MKSRRQASAEEATGSSLDTDFDSFQRAEELEAKRYAKEQERINRLKESDSYYAMQKIKYVMDDWNLDGILGLFGIGDWLVLLLGLPTIYFSLFKLHSVRLTVICIGYFVTDLLVGVIPVLGDLIDFFYRGYRKSYDLIEGYIHNDPDALSVINKKFWKTILITGLVIFILFYLVSAILSFIAALFK